MSKESKLIPELRFPEFVNDGEWELRLVEDFFDVCSSKRVLQKDWTNDGVPFYRTRELVSLSKNEPFGSEIFITDSLYEELKTIYGVPKNGDFLISGVGTLGISYQVKDDDKFYFKDGNVLWFKLGKNVISSFFKYCFESEHIQKQIEGQTSKSTVGTYTITNAKKTKFWYTRKLQEQQKIAACLSSLDELITAHNDKLEALKDHKKGLMQNLFPQESETVPKIRFPEFEGDGEWVEKKLGECLLRNPEYGLNEPAVPYSEKLPTYLRITDISESGNYLFENKVSVDSVVTENDYLSDGDIVLARTGASVGKSYKYRAKDGELVYAGFLIRVRPNPDRLHSELLFQYFSTTTYWDWVKKVSERSGQPGINGSQYFEMPFCIPPTLKEQKKIASCLSAVDCLITAQQEKIEQLQQHKKGLMQGLFPKVES